MNTNHLKWQLYNLYRQYIIGWRSVYYSAFGEDAVVNALLGGKRDGFFVDIGAFHPEKYSNTNYFVRHKNWHGINVEPNPKNFKLFQKTRKKDVNLQCGIGPNTQPLEYFMFLDGLYNTFDKSVAEANRSAGIEQIDTLTIPIRTLVSVFEEYCSDKQVDLLDIDVEGFDLEVLKTNDWTRFRPKVVMVEDHGFDFAHTNSSEVFSYMIKQNYELKSYCQFTSIFKDHLC